MHDPLVALQLIYQVFSKVLGSIVLRTRSHTTKDVEILILRHQLTVLRRSTPRPRMTWTDRAVIAVLTRLLPARRLGLPVTLATDPDLDALRGDEAFRALMRRLQLS